MSNKARSAFDPVTQPGLSRPGSGQASAGNTTPPASTGVGLRGTVDALLQGALVDLFQAYGVALAPLPRDTYGEPNQYPDLSALIGFTCAGNGSSASGKLSLSVPSPLFDIMRGDSAHLGRAADWMRELANQLMGRFKNRLLPYGTTLQAGLPGSIGREALEAQLTRATNLRVYRARTLRGEVVATLDGTLRDAELCYVGQPNEAKPAAEGELILF